MEVIRQTGKNAVIAYLDLFNLCKEGFKPTSGFYNFYKSLASGKALFLKNNFELSIFFLRDKSQNVAAAIYFRAKKNSYHSSLGGFLGQQTLTKDQIHHFLTQIRNSTPNETYLFPLNGHLNLGFGAISPSEHDKLIGVLTSSHQKIHDHFFTHKEAKIARHFFALTTCLDPTQKGKLEEEVSNFPKGISTRRISRLHFKRDINIYNDLINRCMTHHYNFHPLTNAENWDLMRHTAPLISTSLFQFLIYQGKEIGFCFAMLDFNQVLGNQSDFMQFMTLFYKRHKITRGRILSSGILPEFQGKKIFKFVRNQILIEFIKKNVTEVESSYIDEKNHNSMGNVKSKGAKISHQYTLFSS